MDFSDKVVLITGASGGIGAACALHFAKLSAKLSLVGRNVENLQRVVDSCEEANGIKPLTIIADISIEEDIERIVNETVNEYGGIDVLVNNAGILFMANVMDDIANYDRISATNIRGTYLMTQRAIPHLIKTRGNIINISSVVSTTPIPTMTPYCMTKAAIDMFTKCVALELAPKGVRVNAVNPGPVETSLFIRAGINEEVNKQMFAGMGAAMPLRRLPQSEDVAKMVAFLASDNASSVTGSCHLVDSGLHLGDPVMRA